ncbi:thioredoxin family protein [Maribacter sp. PR1]|uniref:Thioredoxin family protein n=1 Tax=Maribacter cobaltidurans TaxID=1178778 RepID=A0ABU7IVN8_9FLAO|nr:MULTISPECIES: thioredoxin family protein [Maribacter]MDC6389671.1 thioredoxin family protein [Maribacter sp. PR1]MEE1977060.1 thioredoxin family protein [Maribacter cobaltidurans]
MNYYKILLVAIFLMGINFSFAQEWKSDFNVAKEIAKKENKPIILVFQGSDWCAPCIKLDREVWSTEEFKKYAKGHYVMLQADFPRKKKNALPETQAKANAKLASLYNQRGIFPFVVVLDENGEVKGETSYKKMNPKEYINLLDSFSK